MNRTKVAALVAVTILVALGLGLFLRNLVRDLTPTPVPSPPRTDIHPSLLFGRVTTLSDEVHEGVLRWGGDEEAFWSDTFNGVRLENQWAEYLSPDEPPAVTESFELFGIRIGNKTREIDLGRPFMSRFGDISRIDANFDTVRVTLKSGTIVTLDRMDASDFDDGVRVWTGGQNAIDLDSRVIRSIELFSAPASTAPPRRLYGTVTTEEKTFTGFVRWNRDRGFAHDQLVGRDAEDRHVRIAFDGVSSIEKIDSESSRVRFTDGREIALSGTRDVGRGHRGVYVDDSRFGRVLVPWYQFERLDVHTRGGGPSYDDFPPGHRLTGTVLTRSNEHLTGAIVFDLDESETTETLDAPAGGTTYIIPFGLIATIIPPDSPRSSDELTRVILHQGEEIALERRGDLGAENGGTLVFPHPEELPVYVPWAEVVRIDFERPRAMYPPLD